MVIGPSPATPIIPDQFGPADHERVGAVETCRPPAPTVPAPTKPVRRGKAAAPPVMATERDYQKTIIDTAKMLGWRVHHNRPAMRTNGTWYTAISGQPGFPDLVLAHEYVHRVLFVELKRSDGQLTEDQERWGKVLTAAGADWRLLKVPDMLHDFCQLLADLPRQSFPLR